MTRRKSRRRDWRVILFLVISLLIVLSMILFTILPALPIY